MTVNQAPQYNLDSFMEMLARKNPHETEFHQAVREVMAHIIPFANANSKYGDHAVLERLAEPDRVIMFRVPWMDDAGKIQVSRGYRIQWLKNIGPYKGGLRFHPSVNLSVLKFLAFEQVFKNALTTLSLGAAKGGSDFDPKGKSDNEVMRFCQSFMDELFRHIGADTDVPAGDIGVGGREIGYLFGKYLKLRNEFTGTFTGKGIYWGGSLMRPEATGYGAVYFAEEMLATRGEHLEGKICLVSGSGNVAQYTVEQLLKKGAKPITVSDSDGFIYDADGIDVEKLAWIKKLKNVRRGRIKEYAKQFKGSVYTEVDPRLADRRTFEPEYGHNPIWDIPAQCIFPSATQNEINGEDANGLIQGGAYVMSEGANMPSTARAVDTFLDAKILYGPGKAANAGGVAVSGLEMSQNSIQESWTWPAVDAKLRKIMRDIHNTCVKYGKESDDYTNYVKGANIGGFVKVADTIIEHGLV